MVCGGLQCLHYIICIIAELDQKNRTTIHTNMQWSSTALSTTRMARGTVLIRLSDLKSLDEFIVVVYVGESNCPQLFSMFNEHTFLLHKNIKSLTCSERNQNFRSTWNPKCPSLPHSQWKFHLPHIMSGTWTTVNVSQFTVELKQKWLASCVKQR